MGLPASDIDMKMQGNYGKAKSDQGRISGEALSAEIFLGHEILKYKQLLVMEYDDAGL